jgi:FkbM family methyltransferase
MKLNFLESRRKQLSALKWGLMQKLGVDPVVRAFEALPRAQAVRILESVALEGRLDYAPRDIRMELRSVSELSRLDSCKKEPETVAWIERELRAGDVLYDVGANVGAYSLIACAATGGEAQVYAFEPSFSTFTALCTNLRLNRCGDAVLPLQLALSDRTQILSFNYSNVATGAALHAVGEPLDMYGKPFVPAFVQPVISYRLDDLVASFGLAPPTHLKIDVDGAELLVLQGAARALGDPRMRSLLVELQLGSEMHRTITELLAGHGLHLRHEHRLVTTPEFANCEFARQ